MGRIRSHVAINCVVGYVPMIETPTPMDLHLEDTAFFHSVQTALGTRQTSEKASLTAVRSVGGLQLPGLVEAVVSGVANEVIYLLNGDTTASRIAAL